MSSLALNQKNCLDVLSHHLTGEGLCVCFNSGLDLYMSRLYFKGKQVAAHLVDTGWSGNSTLSNLPMQNLIIGLWNSPYVHTREVLVFWFCTFFPGLIKHFASLSSASFYSTPKNYEFLGKVVGADLNHRSDASSFMFAIDFQLLKMVPCLLRQKL